VIRVAIRTDKPVAEILLLKDQKILDKIKWHAHRELSDTIYDKLEEILANAKLTVREIDTVIVYKGPGSFTGLRIGVTVANGLAYSLGVPVVGISDTDWSDCNAQVLDLVTAEASGTVIPEYGSEAIVTKPRK